MKMWIQFHASAYNKKEFSMGLRDLKKEMKPKHLLLCLLLILATTLNAQTILKGDMNDDTQVNIADVTSLVDVVLGKAPQETISIGSPYMVDNSYVVGTWYAPDGSSFTLNEDGTTDYSNAATYKFRPVQGVLTFYDASDNPIKAIVLNEVTSDYLMAVDYATNTFTKYTKQGEQPVDPDTHEYVDLGLPSGTLWATCNIGANSPDEYGDYFAWGETGGYNSGKTTFDFSTYKWCNGSSSSLTKYNFSEWYGIVDDKTELDPEDDAAYVNWGPAWRTPSKEQLDELINSSYTTTEWITQNGVDGRKIMSLKNGNFIFLPAAGRRHDDTLLYPVINSYYWSRTLYTVNDYPLSAWSLFSTCQINGEIINNYATTRYEGRESGCSVRPVRNSE